MSPENFKTGLIFTVSYTIHQLAGPLIPDETLPRLPPRREG